MVFRERPRIVSIQLVSPASGEVGIIASLFQESSNVSIQLVFPASGESFGSYADNWSNCCVSIQLVSPASGELLRSGSCSAWSRVSIQLVSPASGEIDQQSDTVGNSGFHSISFPSEWGVGKYYSSLQATYLCVSIQLVSPASGEQEEEFAYLFVVYSCFHSISFPSEWGADEKVYALWQTLVNVSIQLVSPASGESSPQKLYPERDSAIKSTHR